MSRHRVSYAACCCCPPPPSVCQKGCTSNQTRAAWHVKDLLGSPSEQDQPAHEALHAHCTALQAGSVLLAQHQGAGVAERLASSIGHVRRAMYTAQSSEPGSRLHTVLC